MDEPTLTYITLPSNIASTVNADDVIQAIRSDAGYTYDNAGNFVVNVVFPKEVELGKFEISPVSNDKGTIESIDIEIEEGIPQKSYRTVSLQYYSNK